MFFKLNPYFYLLSLNLEYSKPCVQTRRYALRKDVLKYKQGVILKGVCLLPTLIFFDKMKDISTNSKTTVHSNAGHVNIKDLTDELKISTTAA
jgi:hypothetical protein